MWEKDINIHEVKEIISRTKVFFGVGAINKINGILVDLKAKGVDNVIYSNWFTKSQVGRLKKIGLDSYFKEIIGAEHYMKPSTDGFIEACGPFKPNECVMVGDNYIKDIIGPKEAGLRTIYYSPKEDVNVPHIKRLVNIKKMY